jgi:hypothetical protein
MNGIEKRLTTAWRSLRRHLPSEFAEAVRVPSKKVLRKLGVVGGTR